jgi:hypothetical protein
MIKSLPVSLALMGLLAACAPQSQPSGYFDSLNPDPAALGSSPQQQMDDAEANAGAPTTADTPMADATVDGVDGDGAMAGTEMATLGNNPGISQTQDFGVIKQQETIESDAAKLQALAEDYQVIDPTPLPERTSEVNIAAYAINQTNQVGNKIYIRHASGDSGCLRYSRDQDQAQRVFLASGGPKLDPRNLDPDGDGFACKWTPDAYRSLVR